VHYVYIVRCADGTLYTGYARDPLARVEIHNRRKGAQYTASRGPVALVYLEGFARKSDALQREYELKQLGRAGKETVIAAGGAVARDDDPLRVPFAP
jgi:predicted GIY-YIG superfamily endonuclease